MKLFSTLENEKRFSLYDVFQRDICLFIVIHSFDFNLSFVRDFGRFPNGKLTGIKGRRERERVGRAIERANNS